MNIGTTGLTEQRSMILDLRLLALFLFCPYFHSVIATEITRLGG